MSNLFDPPKFAVGSIIGVDSNAFTLMAHFRLCARKSLWLPEETKKVIDKAMDGDYSDLIVVLSSHLTEDQDSEGGEE